MYEERALPRRKGSKWTHLDELCLAILVRDGRGAVEAAQALERTPYGITLRLHQIVTRLLKDHPVVAREATGLRQWTDRMPADEAWQAQAHNFMVIEKEIACQQSTALNSATPSQP